MNYKYKTIDKAIIVSEEEHKAITKQHAEKKQIIYLRGGKLMLNMAFVGYINETEDLTDREIEKREEYLKLPPEERSQQTFTKKEFKPLIEGTNWQKIGGDKDWKNCKECKVPHFIPDDKEICLGCIGIKILAKK